MRTKPTRPDLSFTQPLAAKVSQVSATRLYLAEEETAGRAANENKKSSSDQLPAVSQNVSWKSQAEEPIKMVKACLLFGLQCCTHTEWLW